MYSAPFEYTRANSVAEALSIVSQNENAKLLAGGHSLIPALKLRLSQPALLVDIGGIKELKGISVSGNTLSIGALTTHAEIAASKDVQTHCPALAAACGNVGDPQVRNWGTLGGNLAHADPSSDPPTVMVACGATIHVQGSSGSRSIAAENFFEDLFVTALRSDEIITRVEIPSMAGMKTSYAKMAHPASRYAVVGVAVALQMDGGTVKSARVAIGGATPKAMRASGAEQALTGSSLDAAALDNAAKALAADIGDDAMGDIYASADYRKTVAGAYLKKAIKAL
ncbi:MAG: xanthine dehydrogenase family protein subunit M [Anaerolineae bacterium]|nr:xanthine dehydrogenase family protein subunit M [Anaerolineae bacterium]